MIKYDDQYIIRRSASLDAYGARRATGANMYRYICEYCKSHLDLIATACHNCGAPVPYIHPATNLHNNPRFAPDWSLQGGREISLSCVDPSVLEWARNHCMTPEEQEEQVKSFAFGNTNLSSPKITKEDIEAELNRRADIPERG